MGIKRFEFTVKSLAMAVAFALCLCGLVGLVACGASSRGLFTIDTDEAGIHVVAENEADGEGSESITVDEGHSLSIAVAIDEGTFHVKVTDSAGAAVFDKDVTENATYAVGIDGEIGTEIQAIGASGTIDIAQV